MKYYVMTLFPEMFEQVMGSSIMGKAIDQGLIKFSISGTSHWINITKWMIIPTVAEPAW